MAMRVRFCSGSCLVCKETVRVLFGSFFPKSRVLVLFRFGSSPISTLYPTLYFRASFSSYSYKIRLPPDRRVVKF